MISAGQNPDLIVLYIIDQPMLVIDAPGPATGQFMLERLRLAGAGKGGALHLLDQLDQTQRFLAILLDPPGQILEGRGIKLGSIQNSEKIVRLRKINVSITGCS